VTFLRRTISIRASAFLPMKISKYCASTRTCEFVSRAANRRRAGAYRALLLSQYEELKTRPSSGHRMVGLATYARDMQKVLRMLEDEKFVAGLTGVGPPSISPPPETEVSPTSTSNILRLCGLVPRGLFAT
jgi:hypothetical protein